MLGSRLAPKPRVPFSTPVAAALCHGSLQDNRKEAASACSYQEASADKIIKSIMTITQGSLNSSILTRGPCPRKVRELLLRSGLDSQDFSSEVPSRPGPPAPVQSRRCLRGSRHLTPPSTACFSFIPSSVIMMAEKDTDEVSPAH